MLPLAAARLSRNERLDVTPSRTGGRGMRRSSHSGPAERALRGLFDCLAALSLRAF